MPLLGRKSPKTGVSVYSFLDTPTDTKGGITVITLILKGLLILHLINYLGEKQHETVEDEQPRVETPFHGNRTKD